MNEIILKRFENPDEIRNFEKGKFEIIKLNGMTIGRATYQPGWKWSVDVSPLSGTDFCEVEHLGMVISGQATCAFKDGEVHTMKPSQVIYSILGRSLTIVGLLETRNTSLYIFKAQTNTQTKFPFLLT